MKVLIPTSRREFDPSETALPWKALVDAGHRVVFATPDGKPGEADQRTLTGKDLGLFSGMLKADKEAQGLYAQMARSDEFQNPIAYDAIDEAAFDAVYFPGGHAPGMKECLESPILQKLAANFLAQGKPVAAICHGVLIPARAIDPETGKSALHGRKTTGLTSAMESLSWWLTRLWVGEHYRTYACTVQRETAPVLASPDDFKTGPLPLVRDSAAHPERGFAVRDGNYLTARWPGDLHRFCNEFTAMLGEATQSATDSAADATTRREAV